MRRKLDFFISIFFLIMFILSISLFSESYFYVLGLAFLIAGLYGIICYYKKVKFLF